MARKAKKTNQQPAPVVDPEIKLKELDHYNRIRKRQRPGFLAYRAAVVIPGKERPAKAYHAEKWADKNIPRKDKLDWMNKAANDATIQAAMQAHIQAYPQEAPDPGDNIFSDDEEAIERGEKITEGEATGRGEEAGEQTDDRPKSSDSISPNVVAIQSMLKKPSEDWRFAELLYKTKIKPEEKKERFKCIVSLYVRVNDTNTIQDRIAVKLVMCNNENQADLLLDEAKKIENLPECDNIIRLKAYSKDPNQPSDFRIITEYCPFGSVADLIHRYHENDEGSLPRLQIPEPYIWLTFYALSEAIYAFNSGKCGKKIEDKSSGADLATSDYKKISRRRRPLLHRDIKPDNVFLGAPTDPYLSYPTPIIADFDISLYMDSQFKKMQDQQKLWKKIPNIGKRKEWEDLHEGTDGLKPPEILCGELKYEISEKSDIWAAGLVIWEMMHALVGNPKLKELREKAEERFKNGDVETTVPFNEEDMDLEDTTLEDVKVVYSRPLYVLVKKCLKNNPEERPDFADLRKDTRKWLEKMKVFGGIKGDQIDQYVQVNVGEDQFATGLVKDIPRKRKRRETEE